MANCIATVSPQKIIIGGGVMKKAGLLSKIQQQTRKLLNGYIKHELILENIENYIVSPGLEENSGVCGAIALAEQAIMKSRK